MSGIREYVNLEMAKHGDGFTMAIDTGNKKYQHEIFVTDMMQIFKQNWF